MLTHKDWFTRTRRLLTLQSRSTFAKAMNRSIRYKGYEVAPAAARLPNGLFAANLTIEKTGPAPARAYSFDAIDFFFDEEHALAYAFRWGRLWVDSHC
ncbi:conserved hypothetical protein [Burkholderia thailandensis E264]|uniref:Uncharacterized protein n=2 Tax=Burkholderia thailandensis TaxID=57975 RepID=Q2T6N9_BURTA|nr:conserved hypothetical protein [Burkholderia thailandensis E264]